MLRPALLALAFFAQAAFAGLTLLPGSSPQTGATHAAFPAPIRLLATDASGHPLQGVQVDYVIQDFVLRAPCRWDAMEYKCSQVTGADGTITANIFPANPGDYSVDFYSAVGSARAHFTVVYGPPPYSIEVVSGSDQRVVAGNPFPEPITVRVTQDGMPAAGVQLGFSGSGDKGAEATYPLSAPEVSTDSGGYATSVAFTAGTGLGEGTLAVSAYDPDVLGPVASVKVPFVVTTPNGATYTPLASLWWAGPSQAGWGVSTMQHEDRLFAMYFVYDRAGHPTWRLLEGDWLNGFGTTYFGTLLTAKGSPFFAYDTTRFQPSSGGYGDLTLYGGVAGNVDVEPPGDPGVLATIQPFPVGDVDRPPLGVTDVWWGGASQSGWGMSITEQHGALYSLWFTYDASGEATWYAMAEGFWTGPGTWTGSIQKTSGPPMGSGARYDVAQFHANVVGNYTLTFTDSGHAVMDYQLEGHAGTLQLERFPF